MSVRTYLRHDRGRVCQEIRQYWFIVINVCGEIVHMVLSDAFLKRWLDSAGACWLANEEKADQPRSRYQPRD